MPKWNSFKQVYSPNKVIITLIKIGQSLWIWQNEIKQDWTLRKVDQRFIYGGKN